MAFGKLLDIGAAIAGEKLATTIFLQVIKPFTAEQVNQAIHENIDLWDSWDSLKREQYLRVGIQFRRRILENIDNLTPEKILTYMRDRGEGTPWFEQAQAIRNTPGGVEWFADQVNYIREEIRRYYNELAI